MQRRGEPVHRRRADAGLCLTDCSERLDDTECAAIQCGSLAESVTECGLFVGERSGFLSHDALHAARCLDGTDASPDVLLDCAGGQFVDEDIGACIRHGLDDPRCFEPETLISRVANDTAEDYLQLTALDNEITRFRRELYGLEGGDLDEVLSAEGDRAFAVVEEKVEKAKGGAPGTVRLRQEIDGGGGTSHRVGKTPGRMAGTRVPPPWDEPSLWAP